MDGQECVNVTFAPSWSRLGYARFAFILAAVVVKPLQDVGDLGHQMAGAGGDAVRCAWHANHEYVPLVVVGLRATRCFTGYPAFRS